jgi:hypothetical protein
MNRTNHGKGALNTRARVVVALTHLAERDPSLTQAMPTEGKLALKSHWPTV